MIHKELCILLYKAKNISQVCKVSKCKDCNDIICNIHRKLNDILDSINKDKYDIYNNICIWKNDILHNICKGMYNILDSKHSYNIYILDRVI